VNRRWPPLIAATALSLVLLALAPTASARCFGSTLRATPNANYGCESALVAAPLGGFALQPTGQTSCTYRHGGYLFTNRATFIAPGTGRVTRIRVKS
jgi:hypothetical protein